MTHLPEDVLLEIFSHLVRMHDLRGTSLYQGKKELPALLDASCPRLQGIAANYAELSDALDTYFHHSSPRASAYILETFTQMSYRDRQYAYRKCGF